jgi:hypothetical protein
LGSFRIDEQRDTDAVLRQLRANAGQQFALSRHIQTAFRRDFSSAFRHQAAIRRTDFTRNPHHLGARRHLQVESGLQSLTTHADVAILNMATIFTQMNGDAVRA